MQSTDLVRLIRPPAPQGGERPGAKPVPRNDVLNCPETALWRRFPHSSSNHFSKVIPMLDPKVLEDISSRLGALIAASPARDIEKNAKAMLSSMLARLDLVTREEFEVQGELLARTRQRLEALEARVASLEAGR